MALAVTARFDFIDQKGKTSFTKVRIPTGFTFAQYVEFVQDAAQLIADTSVGILTGASFTVSMDLSGSVIKATADILSDVAEKALFQFGSAVSGFFSRLNLPAFNETYIPVGTDAVDTADPDIMDFTATMVDGIAITSGTLQPVTDRGDDLVSVDIAVEQFQKS